MSILVEYNWVLFALFASIASSSRDIFIKKYINEASDLVVASTRLIAFFFIFALFPLRFVPTAIELNDLIIFVILLSITVVLTFLATTLKVKLLQSEQISKISPLLSLTPIFIVPWAVILLNESVNYNSALGIIIAALGALVILYRKNELTKINADRYLISILVILSIYGLTTVIDKVEIGIVGAYLYTLIWTGSSALIGLFTILRHGRKAYIKYTLSFRNILQSILWASSFYAQQIAVQASYKISMNTAYIKSIMYISILLNVLVGGRLFREESLLRKIIGATLIIIGNLIILFWV